MNVISKISFEENIEMVSRKKFEFVCVFSGFLTDNLQLPVTGSGHSMLQGGVND